MNFRPDFYFGLYFCYSCMINSLHMYRLSTLILILLGCLPHILNGADYYWVGGNGNWSDITHWMTTSGGTAQHNDLPTAADNVFFDANSFTAPNQSITIDLPNVFCRDLDFTAVTNNPALAGQAEYILNISGSARLSATMRYNFGGSLSFQTTEPAQTVNLQNHRVQRDVLFNGGATGGWTLQSPLTLDSIFYIIAGSLNFNNQAVTCNRWFIDGLTTTILDLGASLITVNGSTLNKELNNEVPVVDINATNLTINPGTSRLTINGTDVSMYVVGAPTVNLNEVLVSNPSGLFRINYKGPFYPINSGNLRIERLELRKNTRIHHGHTINNLVIAPDKYCLLQSGSTYRIGTITAVGNCQTPIRLAATNPGQQAIIETNLTNTVEYVLIQGLRINGTPVVANNSFNLGNNSNWTINEKNNETLYWIGGTGNWNDPSHWSLTSGGMGGACIPTPADNVIFDENSFAGNATVNLNADNAYCRDFSWVNLDANPIMVGTENQELHVFGSMLLHDRLTWNVRGDVYFESKDAAKTITSRNKMFNRDIYFAGAGEYVLQDSLLVYKTVFFNAGTLRLNGQTLEANYFESRLANNRLLDLRNGTLRLFYRANNPYGPYLNLTMDYLRVEAVPSQVELLSGASFNHSAENPANSLPITYDKVRMAGNWNSLYFAYNQFRINDLVLEANADVYAFLNSNPNPTQISIGRLFLNRSHLYRFNEFTYNIDSIEALGSCGGIINITSLPQSKRATFNCTRDQQIFNVVLKDIGITGGARYIARRSKSLGNTPGWEIIDTAVARTLYWVGGTGQWNETAHWSLSSGGAGGECIPTPIDDVIFDRNSFTANNQQVEIEDEYLSTCHNFTWDGPSPTTYLRLESLHCHGSFRIITPLNAPTISFLYMKGDSTHQLSTNNAMVYYLNLEGGGRYQLETPWSGYEVALYKGVWETNDQSVNITRFYGANWTDGQSVRLELGNSTITISYDGWLGYEAFYFGGNAFIDPGASSLVFTSSRPYLTLHSVTPLHLNRVLFTNPLGYGTINSNPYEDAFNQQFIGSELFNFISFSGDGEIIGNNIIDSLLFTPGHAYVLEANKVQQVRDYFRIRGNNCAQIKLSSSIPGTQAIVEKTSGSVEGDFIQMRDQRARGGANFFAGNHSEGIANNTGWVFGTASDYVDFGILGADIVTCQGNSVILNENNVIGAQVYRWNTSAATPSIQITVPGRYWVSADYGNNCIIRDSINIVNPQDFILPLGNDTTLCSGASHSLNGTIDLLGITYAWENGSKNPMRTIDSAGLYILSATLSGCETRDSIQVDYIHIPDLNINQPRDLCAGDTVLLSIAVPMATYRWNTGETTPDITITQSNTYRAEVQVGQCIRIDSTFLNFVTPPVFDFGVDQSICLGDTLRLTIPHPSASIRWNDLDQTSSRLFQPTASTTISAVAAFGRCQAADTVNITVKPLPIFDLGPDSTACAGETIAVNIPLSGVQITWDDGATDSVRIFNQNVSRSVQVTLDGCTRADAVNYTFITPPVFDLGPDQTICFGDSVRLNIPVNGATVVWEDGQTNLNRSVLPLTSQPVTAIAAFGRCTSFDSTFIHVTPLPDYTLGPDSMACVGESVTLNIPLSGVTILWNDGLTDSVRTFTTTSQVSVNVTGNGCSKQENILLSFVTPPALNLVEDSLVICAGESVFIGQDIPGATYRWQDGRTSAFVRDTPETSVLYRLRAGFGHCISEDSVAVTVNPLPRLFLGIDRALCPGTDIILQAEHNGTNLLWDDNTSNLTRTIRQPGTYFAQVRLGQCFNFDTIRISPTTTNFTPLGPDTVICSDRPLKITAGPANYIYSWSSGESSAEITINKDGAYGLTIFDGRCYFRDTINVIARQCTYFGFYAPNAFSPNGDGVNDVFSVHFPPAITIQQFTLEVYDRYGNLMFSTSDPLAGWDGTRQGQDLSEGVFVYRLAVDYTDDIGAGSIQSGGDVTIIR